MITEKSKKREVADLQRLLVSLGYLDWSVGSTVGTWGKETQRAVLAGYDHLGWEHPKSGRWVSSAALAALAADRAFLAGGGGTHAGGGGTHAGGGGTHAGGGGTHAGGGGTHAGGGGTPDD